MEHWGKVRAISARSKANVTCKKHPKHRQSPGVCSICLNEKLSQLSNSDCSSSSSGAARSRSSSSSASSLSSYVSSLSSSNASSRASPAVDFTRRSETNARNSIRFFTKSRSMAPFVSRRRKEEAGAGRKGEGEEAGVVKGGFWSKLMARKSSRALMHSRTTRERRLITSLH